MLRVKNRALCVLICKGPFDVVLVTLHGGVKGSGRGVNYKIKVLSGKDSGVLHFDSLWVGSYVYAVEASKPHPFTSADGFSKGDTVMIYASMHQAADRIGAAPASRVDLLERGQQLGIDPGLADEPHGDDDESEGGNAHDQAGCPARPKMPFAFSSASAKAPALA